MAFLFSAWAVAQAYHGFGPLPAVQGFSSAAKGADLNVARLRLFQEEICRFHEVPARAKESFLQKNFLTYRKRQNRVLGAGTGLFRSLIIRIILVHALVASGGFAIKA